MSMGFKSAGEFTEQHGLFVSLVGSTNSGKSFSSLRLARGIAGPKGRIACVDTEGGRLLHLKKDFDFDVMLLAPPHRPARYLEAAQTAQEAGYDALVIDSWTQQWRGIGGILDWADDEATAMVERKRERARQNNWTFDEAFERDKVKMASLIKPKMAHKLLVNGLLGLRIPIIFSIRGEISVDPNPPKPAPGQRAQKASGPVEVFKPLCDKQFPFEMTVSFRLSSEHKGVIDLSDPKSWKMEKAHQAIFRDGDLLSEGHGAKLIAWARGQEAVQAQQEQTQQPAPRRTLGQYLDECLAGCQTADDVERLEHDDPTVRNALAGPSADRVRAKLEGRYYALVSPPPEQPADELDAPMAAE